MESESLSNPRDWVAEVSEDLRKSERCLRAKSKSVHVGSGVSGRTRKRGSPEIVHVQRVAKVYSSTSPVATLRSSAIAKSKAKRKITYYVQVYTSIYMYDK